VNKNVKIAIPVIIFVVAGVVILIGIETNMPSDEIIDSDTISTVDSPTETEKQTNETQEVIIIQPSDESIQELTADQILNKKIPPNYEFGNSFNNLLQNGLVFSEIKNETEKASIRFTNQYEGFLDKITLNLHVFNETVAIIGIQGDDGLGNPDGNLLNYYSDPLVVPKGQKARLFSFYDEIFLEKNKIYHIVIQNAPTVQSSSDVSNESPQENIEPFIILHYRGNAGGYPFNPEDPDIFLPDPALNSLFFDGIKWKVLDRWPSFLLTYSDGHLEGQPYTLAAPWAVSDNTYVGQTIIPHSEYNASKFSFVLSLKGEPSEPLYYGIQDNKGSILDTGIIATSNELAWEQKLVEVELEEPIKLDAGKLYRFYVYSTIPRPENQTDFYRIYGQEFSFDYSLTYGGLIQRLTISHDYGKTWAAWLDADTLFKITTTG